MERSGPVGAVFTPPFWARWALDRLDAPGRVAAGASFCDPTAGEGAFAHGLAEAWAGKSGTFDRTWANRITLVDREPAFLETFARSWRGRWGFSFPEKNLRITDMVTDPPQTPFDLVVGNPPWATYPDLSPEDQDRYRPWFSRLDLVGRPQDLLLGRSGLDLAALVTARVFSTLVAPGGWAGFFLPLSLFHNEGAPTRWRRWRPDAVFDLTALRPFPGVSTRCGWAEFAPDRPPSEGARLPYFVGTPGEWTALEGCSDGPGAPWRVVHPGTPADLPRFILPAAQRPRQGLNTGGLNAAFQVEAPPERVDPTCVHPLVPRDGGERPRRWILVPYHRDGSIFREADLERTGLQAWWAPWRDRLAARRGVLLGSQLTKGRWWALLGVGAYAFAPYKVVWSAYGKDRLDARIWGPRTDGTVWQADQALQAYVPCATEADARRILEFINSAPVAGYLASLRGAGTRNWAQPGRFHRLWTPGPGAGTREGTT